VYEFYSEDQYTADLLSADVEEFRRFVDLCVLDPHAASQMLTGGSLSHQAIAALVERYAKEVRRLQVDLKHDREQRILAIRHRLESELVDEFPGSNLPWPLVNQIVETLVPRVPEDATTLTHGPGVVVPIRPVTVNVSQQFFENVHGVVTQELHGSVSVGYEARQLAELIQQFGGQHTSVLNAAASELEDPDARASDRLGARQRLKSFLWKIQDKLSAATFDVLQKYIESKLNL
jgi:hypothetical protein